MRALVLLLALSACATPFSHRHPADAPPARVGVFTQVEVLTPQLRRELMFEAERAFTAADTQVMRTLDARRLSRWDAAALGDFYGRAEAALLILRSAYARQVPQPEFAQAYNHATDTISDVMAHLSPEKPSGRS